MQSYTHAGEYIRGGSLGSLVKVRPLATSAMTNGYSGRVVTINSTGQFVLGNENVKTRMPLFLIAGVESPSVYNENAGSQSTGYDWVPAVSGHTAMAIVATGGFEFQTTEFNTSATTYAPNTYLTADSNGILNPLGSVSGQWVVGVCSVHENAENNQNTSAYATQLARGRNANGKEVITFWTYFLPGVTLS